MYLYWVKNMRNVMEKQLSWFALFMTAFYSVLTSCRADSCGHEQLQRCARPLQKMSSGPTDFFKSKEHLEQICPELESGMQCIHKYTQRCMNDIQRKHFIQLYSGTHIAVMELCQDGPYQEKFLAYAPCMVKVKTEFDQCSSKYGEIMQEITSKQSNDMKLICCSFQEYLTCSHNTVLKTCGTEAAKFTKEFLDRMSASLISMHCQSYSYSQCVTAENSSPAVITAASVSLIFPIVIIAASRYLF